MQQEPDIPNIPADSLKSGENYLEFLKLVRKGLYDGNSLSIAAPASYWYLRGFPIERMAKVVDYIIYMTYDLHGQWDYGAKWASEGCPEGSCLRSHVNGTETRFALAMITRAGVPANQVVVGMPLYGRSFKMAKTGCHKPYCHFTGPKSGAEPGKCTKVGGYLANYEIAQIIEDGKKGKRKVSQYYDDGDVIVYDGDNWVSFLTTESYDKRQDWVDSENFGGTSDWAVDLNATYVAEDYEDLVSDDYQPCDMTKSFKDLDDLQRYISIVNTLTSVPQQCIDIYAMSALISMYDAANGEWTRSCTTSSGAKQIADFTARCLQRGQQRLRQDVPGLCRLHK